MWRAGRRVDGGVAHGEATLAEGGGGDASGRPPPTIRAEMDGEKDEGRRGLPGIAAGQSEQKSGESEGCGSSSRGAYEGEGTALTFHRVDPKGLRGDGEGIPGK